MLKATLAVLALLVLLVAIGPELVRWHPEAADWDCMGCAPSLSHPFGTDAIGRDILARTLAGGRTSLLVGVLASVIALAIGLFWGAFAGLRGGFTESAMMRVVDVLSALPFLLIVVLLLTLFERSLALVLLAIGGYAWLDLARMARSHARALRGRGWMLAARALGLGEWRILSRHLVPNLLGMALVFLSLTVPNAMLVESFLAFLGLSIAEPAASWGSLVYEGVQEMEHAPWALAFPAGFLVITLGAFQYLGDGLRDLYEPARGFERT